MRSGSPPLSGRRISASVKDREMSSRDWKRRSKELVVLIAKGVSFLARICYRSTHEHPFLASTVLFTFLLYAFLPTFFWFLVSSSPVIICTALLLGTLLSFGQLHMPANEEEEKAKMVHRMSTLRASGIAGKPILRKREECTDENISDSDGEIKDEGVVSSLEVGEPSAKVDSQDKISSESSLGNGKQMESRESGVGVLGVLGRIADRLLGTWHLSGSEGYNQSQQNRVISRSSTNDGADDATEIQRQYRENLLNLASRSTPEVSMHVPLGLAKSEEVGLTDKVESKNVESDVHYYPLLHPSNEHDGHSGFVSDRSESCSPDASISEINPILDELCPFIPTSQADGLNHGTSMHHVRADTDDSGSTSELSTQPHESDYDSDEMAENMEEYKMGGGLSWTIEDEKNVMDLGSSEIERNRRLENLMAKRSVRKDPNREVGHLHDPRNEDTSPVVGNLSQIPIQVSSISTKRKNPFHDESVDIRGLPPIPGSAPSVLLRKSNPFDFPENFSQNDVGPSEPQFQGFTVGTSGIDREEKQNFGMEPNFVPEQRPHAKYHRQLSELSYPRGQSIFKSESLYPIPGQGYHRGLPEQSLDEENFISFTKQGGASLTKIEEGDTLKRESFMAPATTSVPTNMDAWTRPIDESGVHVNFDASRISHVNNTSHGQSVVEEVSTDTVQYQSFTTLETKLDDSGTTVERTFHFGSHGKLDSPKHQSDETTESDSSTESETSSGSEHSGHGMLQASHPSIDKPVVLPSEVSILPEIANKLKAASGLEEKLSDASSDSDEMDTYGEVAVLGGTKEMDEHILSELDVIGDFRAGNLQAGQEQVLKESQLDNNPEHQDNKSLNLEGRACQVDREMKSLAESSGKEDMLVELHTGPNASDSNLQEIEARCLDDIDLALMRVEGSLHDNPVEVEAHSSSKAVDSDLQEIDAHCLDDIDLELMRAEGSLRGSRVECLDDIDLELMQAEGFLKGNSAQVEAHSDPKAGDSDLHEIDARCLNDIDLELMRTEGSLCGASVEVEIHSSPKTAASDLHEIDAQCLDDIDLELMRTEGSLHGNHFEVQGHPGSKPAASDLHEIDARCLDDIELELMCTEGSIHGGSIHGNRFEFQEHPGPKAVAAESSELHEIDAQCLDDIDLELMRTEGSLHGNLVEIGEHSGSKAVDSDLHEIEARSLDDIDLELMRAEGTLRGNRFEVEAHSSSEAVVSDMHVIDARCLDDIDSELMRAEGLLDSKFSEVKAHPSAEAVSSDLHEIEARSLNDIDLAIMHAEGSLHGGVVEDTHPKQVDHQSDLQEFIAQSLDDKVHSALAVKKQETTQEPDLVPSKELENEEFNPREVEAQLMEGLHKASGNQNIPPGLVATSLEQREIEDHSLKDMHIDPSNNEPPKSEKETAHLISPNIVLPEMHETEELTSPMDTHEAIGREGSYSEIEAKSIGELHTVLEKEAPSANHMQNPSDIPGNPEAEIPQTSHPESHPVEAQSSEDATVVAHFDSPAKELKSAESESSSSSNQTRDSGLEIKAELHETEVQTSKNLDEMTRQPREQQEIAAQSEVENRTNEDVVSAMAPVAEGASDGQVNKQLDSNHVSSVGTEANNKDPKPEIRE